MLNDERKSRILDALSRNGRVLLQELVNDLKVSEDTIRRDLKDLDESGLLKRVHGGALPVGKVTFQFSKREKESPTLKDTIAKKAASFVKEKQVIFIDGGTTTAQVAAHLKPDLQATFITNCLPTAMRLSELPRLNVRFLGGKVVSDLLLTFGPETLKELSNIQADLCLISIECLDIKYGGTVSNYDDSLVKRAMIEQSAESFVLAEGQKFNRVSPYKVAPISEIGTIITDDSIDKKHHEAFRKSGATILIA
jgi:DeoR/GlpR family transcriptional regulator of sugar metabolism